MENSEDGADLGQFGEKYSKPEHEILILPAFCTIVCNPESKATGFRMSVKVQPLLKLRICLTLMPDLARKKAIAYTKKELCDLAVIENDVLKATHVVTKNQAMTTKIIYALSSGIPLVTIDWLAEMADVLPKAIEGEVNMDADGVEAGCIRLPAVDNFLPEPRWAEGDEETAAANSIQLVGSQQVHHKDTCTSPRISRKHLLAGKTVLMISDAHEPVWTAIIQKCGGYVVDSASAVNFKKALMEARLAFPDNQCIIFVGSPSQRSTASVLSRDHGRIPLLYAKNLGVCIYSAESVVIEDFQTQDPNQLAISSVFTSTSALSSSLKTSKSSAASSSASNRHTRASRSPSVVATPDGEQKKTQESASVSVSARATRSSTRISRKRAAEKGHVESRHLEDKTDVIDKASGAVALGDVFEEDLDSVVQQQIRDQVTRPKAPLLETVPEAPLLETVPEAHAADDREAMALDEGKTRPQPVSNLDPPASVEVVSPPSEAPMVDTPAPLASAPPTITTTTSDDGWEVRDEDGDARQAREQEQLEQAREQVKGHGANQDMDDRLHPHEGQERGGPPNRGSSSDSSSAPLATSPGACNRSRSTRTLAPPSVEAADILAQEEAPSGDLRSPKGDAFELSEDGWWQRKDTSMGSDGLWRSGSAHDVVPGSSDTPAVVTVPMDVTIAATRKVGLNLNPFWKQTIRETPQSDIITHFTKVYPLDSERIIQERQAANEAARKRAQYDNMMDDDVPPRKAAPIRAAGRRR